MGRRVGGPDIGIAWRVLPAVGLFLWVGTVVAIAATTSTPDDAGSATTAFVVGGAIYFTLLFGSVAWWMRGIQRRGRHQLVDRLAVVPVDPGELRRATRAMSTIGYVYVAFGAAVTACGLLVVALGADAGRGASTVMIVMIVAWAVFGLYAWARSYVAASVIVRPLGLDLTQVPQHHVALFGDASWMTGAMSYAGRRHGRSVSITQTPKAAITIVSGPTGRGGVPRSPAEMAALTGERPTQWRGVTVRREGDAVVVERRSRAAGSWFLHDLLLAEAVAGAQA